jgi:hypothetical protein
LNDNQKKGEQDLSAQDNIQRSILPVPGRKHVGLTTYDAKDPDTKYPPIEPLRPPDYGPQGNAFNGEVNRVEIDVDKEALDQDHILTGAERFRVAMALQ